MKEEKEKSSKSGNGCITIALIGVLLLIWIVPGLIHGKGIGEILQSQFESAIKVGVALFIAIGILYYINK